MKLAILETGRPPGKLAGEFGDYPMMFERLLGPGFEIETFDVQDGELPELQGNDASDHWLSRGGLRAATLDQAADGLHPRDRWRENDRRCFGHQAMAEALGGHVQKSAKGWSAGLHRYKITHPKPWIDTDGTIAIPASTRTRSCFSPQHRGDRRFDFTPYAALAWTDRPAISFQFHPEVYPAFAKALIEKRYDSVPDPDLAIASLDAPNDNAVVGGWIRNFLDGDPE